MGGIHNQVPAGLTEVDIIIAGGGTAGCTLAARLSDAFPDLSILVIERGRNNLDDPTVVNPLYWLFNALSDRNNNIYTYVSQPEPSLANRVMTIPSGSILGGSSSVNIMQYARAQKTEIDAWGIKGWSADELLPYMKKLSPGSGSVHGKEGPVQITPGPDNPTMLQSQFVAAAAAVGYPEVQDLQDLQSVNAVQRSIRYVSTDGVRQDSAHTFLHPRIKDGEHKNLTVITEHEVSKVIIDNGKAVGVAVQGTSGFQGSSSTFTVNARKKIVLSSGNLGSPLILQRSGVGDADLLARHGISLVSNLPGVGKNYRDHNLVLVAYFSSLPPHETYNGILKGTETYDDLLVSKSSKLGWSAMEVTSKLRPREKDIESMGPAFKAAWEMDFKNDKTRPVATLAPVAGSEGMVSDEQDEIFAVASFTSHPYSTGSIHAKGPSISDGYDLKTGMLTDAEGVDAKMAIWMYKIQREIVRRMDIYRGEVAKLHPPFPAGSAAEAKHLDGPLGADIEDIAYTAEDDAILNEWIHEAVGTNWHSIGTNKMGSLEDGAVVDENLNVYGVENLKVADVGVLPLNVNSNMANMAYTIGEKAADILIQELSAK